MIDLYLVDVLLYMNTLKSFSFDLVVRYLFLFILQISTIRARNEVRI